MTAPRDHEQYEAPTIQEREKIDTPLVAALGSQEQQTSAAFHPAEDDEGYDAPGIETREPIDTALIGAVGSGESPSAAFHPADAYEPPAIVEREEIDTPLVAIGSGVVCVATH